MKLRCLHLLETYFVYLGTNNTYCIFLRDTEITILFPTKHFFHYLILFGPFNINFFVNRA